MEAREISWWSLALAFALLIIPFVIFYLYRISLWKKASIALLRMSVQLILIGLFLEFLFEENNLWLTLAWLILMVGFATHSALSNSALKIRKFFPLSFLAFLLSSGFILMYFNYFVLRLENLLEARYVIAVAGMLLGNSLKGIIIGINNFYTHLRENRNRLEFLLAVGASRKESQQPFLQRAITEALKPSVASLATMGVVFLPGIMTGQILSGTDPFLSIKYQIAIILIIFVATTLSTLLALIFTSRLGFDQLGMLRSDIFKKEKG